MLHREKVNAQYYERMDTAELEEILRKDAEGTGEFIDDAELFVIMEVVSKRHEEAGLVQKSAEAAWEEFKIFYMPDADTYQDEFPVEAKKKVRRNTVIPWLRCGTAVAAVMALVVIGTFTVRAFGVDIWKELFIWTKDAFEIPDNTESVVTTIADNGPQISSLQEAHIVFGVPQEFVAFDMPKGFQIDGADISETPETAKMVIVYRNESRTIRVQYARSDKSLDIKYEANQEILDNYEVNGINYSLLPNNEDYRIVWRYHNYECSISGDLTLEEAYQILGQIIQGEMQ